MIQTSDLLEIQKLYRGFSITAPTGNNFFSFDQRNNKTIFVPPFKRGDLSELRMGEKIVFSEIVGAQEKNVCGLNCLLYLNHPSKDIFIMDNHNHAFFFWSLGWMRGLISSGSRLVHVDQHKDMREPPEYLALDGLTLEKVFRYSNDVLNVGNFMKPARALGIFSDVAIVDNKDAFDQDWPGDFILDVDLDIFSKEMAYINEAYKIGKIRSWIVKAKFITFATSPFFMDQPDALRVLKELLDS